MKVLFCGVRGSTPAPGANFIRYGGNTSCVALAHDGAAAPSLVLDAGTGLSTLSRALGNQPFHGSILLGHLHWDHTHGLPFFSFGLQPGTTADVHVPSQHADGAEALLGRILSPPHFPVTPSQLAGEWRFLDIDEGQKEIEGFTVLARDIPHPGGRTFGYRVTDGRGTIAYMSDHWPISLGPGPDGLGEYHDNALELADGVDLLIHDSQYTAAEFPERWGLGHSAIEYAAGLARRAGVKRLMLFHHDPARTDDELDEIVADMQRGDVPVTAAAEGLTVELPTAP
jgi:phosphoribosyl 1,2-cyclic phosphodiesterase